jgi:hypothetical protein
MQGGSGQGNRPAGSSSGGSGVGNGHGEHVLSGFILAPVPARDCHSGDNSPHPWGGPGAALIALAPRQGKSLVTMEPLVQAELGGGDCGQGLRAWCPLVVAPQSACSTEKGGRSLVHQGPWGLAPLGPHGQRVAVCANRFTGPKQHVASGGRA